MLKMCVKFGSITPTTFAFSFTFKVFSNFFFQSNMLYSPFQKYVLMLVQYIRVFSRENLIQHDKQKTQGYVCN